MTTNGDNAGFDFNIQGSPSMNLVDAWQMATGNTRDINLVVNADNGRNIQTLYFTLDPITGAITNRLPLTTEGELIPVKAGETHALGWKISTSATEAASGTKVAERKTIVRSLEMNEEENGEGDNGDGSFGSIKATATTICAIFAIFFTMF